MTAKTAGPLLAKSSLGWISMVGSFLLKRLISVRSVYGSMAVCSGKPSPQLDIVLGIAILFQVEACGWVLAVD